MKKKYFYGSDRDVHPSYDGQWIVRFRSKRERDVWASGEGRRICMSTDVSVRYARRSSAFYDTDKMVPYTLD